MSYFIYIHTCPNGKKYVGTTSRKPEYRWGRDGIGYLRSTRFYPAIQKYGWSNIKHEVFEVGSKEDMWYGEKYLISYYNTTDRYKGYNQSEGGERGALGCHRSEELKKHLSEVSKGHKMSESTKQYLSEINRGRKRSVESCSNISKGCQNRKKVLGEDGKYHWIKVTTKKI